MTNNTLQLSKLLERLWAKTQAGDIHWEQLSDARSYQTRQGDFVISVTGNRIGLGGPNTTLIVKKLDGRTVAQASTGALNALSAYGGASDKLNPQS